MATCRFSRPFAAGAAILIITGCGQQDWGYLNGTVKLNGEPVGPGTITLEPVAADQPGAIARFGSDGKYTVMSAGRKEGARTGEYRVLIHGGEDFGVEEAAPRSASQSKIPPRYGNANTSDLTVTIEPGRQTKDFELEP